MKTTRRFDFKYRPLEISASLITVSTVPDSQTYDFSSGVFTPDYTLSPLTLRAEVSIFDYDNVLPSGSVNKQLTNLKWYEIMNGTEHLIGSNASLAFIVGAEGTDDAGQIQLADNVDPSTPLTIRFEAEYLDPRMNQIHKIVLTKLIKCTVEAPKPTLELDAPYQVIYNPIRHADKMTVKATVKANGSPAGVAQRAFLWEVLRTDGTWSEVGNATDGYLDYEIEVSADKSQVEIDRSLMGESLVIRCRANYDMYCNAAAMPFNDASMSRSVTFIRRVPEFWEDIAEMPYNIPPTPYIFPRAIIRDNISLFDDTTINKHFIINWHMATNKASGSLTYNKIGEGINPQLSTSLMSQSIGGVLAVEPVLRDPLAALVDSDGKVITDSDGKIIVFN